jgi:hypothetical protein
MRICVHDLGNLLSHSEGKTPGAHLLLGADNDAFASCPARVVSQDTNGRSHEVVIPFDSRVKLVLYSSFFRLSDAAGAPLPRSAVSIPVTVRPGQAPPTIALRVIGGPP